MRAGWAGVIGIIVPIAAGAQRPTHDYYDAVPSPGRVIGQAAASERLRLFGRRDDPAYHDPAPVDGIDDARGLRLATVSERFSPLLRRFSVPRDFRTLTTEPLHLHINGRG